MIATLKAAPAKARLLLFAFGDFAFNLYWQSLMLYLLFYYTEALDLPVATAALIYTAASVWDGIANFAVGAIIDGRKTQRGYGRWLMIGSIPLGLSCVLTYLPPLMGGAWGIAIVAIGHFLFRTAYAAVNVPYLAMTARISADSGDRAFVAGTRMLFGTIAWMIVARGTVPIGAWIAGDAIPANAYFGAAVVFAAIATAILIVVGATYREEVVPAPGPRLSMLASVRSLLANRAFVTLNLAMMAMICAVTMLSKSVLYYYKYFIGDAEAGQSALAAMGLVGGIGVPLWMIARRWLGARNIWFLASSLTLMGFLALGAGLVGSSGSAQLLLVTMQGVIVGLHFVFWAMLPNTIEYGEQATGIRVEGAVFGLAALLQRIAIGLATAFLGIGFSAAGYVANVEQSTGTLAGMRFTMAIVPAALLALSIALMWLNPLDKGAHEKIVRDLAEPDQPA